MDSLKNIKYKKIKNLIKNYKKKNWDGRATTNSGLGGSSAAPETNGGS